MIQWELAQLNIARLVAPLDSPVLADFVANLDRINALAEESPGFVWRLKDEASDIAGSNHPFGKDLIVNMSVWESIEAVHDYVYRSAHIGVMSRRKQWFKPMPSASMVLWWVHQGHTPNLAEARDRLEHLSQNGPSQNAFTFKSRMHKPAN